MRKITFLTLFFGVLSTFFFVFGKKVYIFFNLGKKSLHFSFKKSTFFCESKVNVKKNFVKFFNLAKPILLCYTTKLYSLCKRFNFCKSKKTVAVTRSANLHFKREGR